VFNREAFFLSHGDYNGSGVAVRVMRYDDFMNSKVFFFSERNRFFPGKPPEPRDMPVMIHFNYHPDSARPPNAPTPGRRGLVVVGLD
jgi:hypothetical protein